MLNLAGCCTDAVVFPIHPSQTDSLDTLSYQINVDLSALSTFIHTARPVTPKYKKRCQVAWIFLITAVQIIKRAFQYASPYLLNQLPPSFRQSQHLSALILT